MTGQDVSVRVDNLRIEGVVALSVELIGDTTADQFQLTLGNESRQYTELFKTTDGKQVGINIGGLVCFSGYVDEANFNYVPEATIELVGRDFSGLLIDETVSQALASAVEGVSASVAVTRIARAFKLTPKVDRTTRVWNESGGYSAGTSVWAVVADLAEKEAFDAWVTPERELVFKARVVPATASLTLAVPPATGRWTPPGGAIVPESLKFTTAKTLALGLKVRCIGYDPRRKRDIVYTAESALRNRSNYRVIELRDRSLVTKADVAARAQNALKGLSKDLTMGSFTCEVVGALRPGQAVDVVMPKGKGERGNGQGEGERGNGKVGADPFEGRYILTKVRHELAEGGRFSTTGEFASRPLTQIRTEEVERETEKGQKDNITR